MRVKLLSTKQYFYNPIRNFIIKTSKISDEVSNLVDRCGYDCDSHRVKTEDGYNLTVHRILPNKRTEYKGAVFLMHGLYRNSADYIATGPKVALPYLLSDYGFDCYLGNARGTKFSTEHEKHSYKSKDFWNFTWEEIGLYDLPAMIKLAIDTSGSSKVNYIGHSQGCTSALAMLASRPEHNKLISQLHLMAPAVFISGSTSTASNFLSQLILKKLSKKLYKMDIGPLLKMIEKFIESNKEKPERILMLYKYFTCGFVGRNKGEVQLSLDAIESFNKFMSPIVSMGQMNHYNQLFKSGKFERYDRGHENKHRYGQSTPPEYNLSNVIVPTYIYHAEQDALCVKAGQDRLVSTLPNVKNYKIIDDYNHLDVMLGKNAREHVYSDMLKFMMQ